MINLLVSEPYCDKLSYAQKWGGSSSEIPHSHKVQNSFRCCVPSTKGSPRGNPGKVKRGVKPAAPGGERGPPAARI
ncbi:hypothetical protein EVAR_23071_1 [Eumeta japonica]|uniref:Uncharacterized protein n=1 Tax=Eumeta variegata TaxID=151549 RepID=A0A4C1VL73_EUMVA|nr:hypothetical protein EVAR_23071_1 [Eumeta japonica]